MNESANQNATLHQSTEEATSLKAVESSSQIEADQAYAQTTVLARETVIPLAQNIEAMTSDIRLIVRESRDTDTSSTGNECLFENHRFWHNADFTCNSRRRCLPAQGYSCAGGDFVSHRLYIKSDCRYHRAKRG